MKKIKYYILIISLCFSCINEKSGSRISIKEVNTIDSLYTINDTFNIGDVRRYGVFPNKSIGQHPKALKDKLDVLLEIAEKGVPLTFPEGIYNRSFNLENRTGVEINSENAVFTGSIQIKNSKKITINGTIQSLVQLYIRDSEDLNFDTVIIKSDTLVSGNHNRSMGCSIHSGSKRIKIKKLIIDDLGSGLDYKYVKAGLTIHGHNNEPYEIVIDSVNIKSSDRHGVYLTGEGIKIKHLNVEKFGIGSGEGMEPMEGGLAGEQLKFSGLWIKNCHNSMIGKAVINTNNSNGEYSINFDIGESFRPLMIDSLVIKSDSSRPKLKRRTLSRTGVIIEELIELNY